MVAEDCRMWIFEATPHGIAAVDLNSVQDTARPFEEGVALAHVEARFSRQLGEFGLVVERMEFVENVGFGALLNFLI